MPMQTRLFINGAFVDAADGATIARLIRPRTRLLYLESPGSNTFEVQDIKPSRERPLEEVKDKVEARWRDDKVAEQLQAKANSLVEKLRAGTALSELATTEGLALISAFMRIKRSTLRQRIIELVEYIAGDDLR